METDKNRQKPTNKEIALKTGKSERTIERWGKEKALAEYNKHLNNNIIYEAIQEEAIKEGKKIAKIILSDEELGLKINRQVLEGISKDLEATEGAINSLDSIGKAQARIKILEMVTKMRSEK